MKLQLFYADERLGKYNILSWLQFTHSRRLTFPSSLLSAVRHSNTLLKPGPFYRTKPSQVITWPVTKRFLAWTNLKFSKRCEGSFRQLHA
jgi:hypothetical protein